MLSNVYKRNASGETPLHVACINVRTVIISAISPDTPVSTDALSPRHPLLHPTSASLTPNTIMPNHRVTSTWSGTSYAQRRP